MTPTEEVIAAEQLLADRRLRDQVFGEEAAGFGEPAWDILLTLFIAGETGVTAATLVSAIPTPARSIDAYTAWIISRRLAEESGETIRITKRGHDVIADFLEKRTRYSPSQAASLSIAVADVERRS